MVEMQRCEPCGQLGEHGTERLSETKPSGDGEEQAVTACLVNAGMERRFLEEVARVTV